MGAHKFVEGDLVENVTELGGGVVKRKRGTVVQVGAKGVEVRFDGGLKTWMRNAQLRVVTEARPDTPAVVETRAPAPKLVPPPAVPAPAAPAAPSAAVSDVEAWLELGRQMIGRAEEAVAFAREAVTCAEEEAADAQARVVEAKSSLKKAEAELGEVRRRTGGDRR